MIRTALIIIILLNLNEKVIFDFNNGTTISDW